MEGGWVGGFWEEGQWVSGGTILSESASGWSGAAGARRPSGPETDYLFY